MNDRAVSVFENYDVEILRTAKGRGALLGETAQGWLILKEYTGPAVRLEVQEKLLSAIRDSGFSGVEQLQRNREGELISYDQDRTAYIVKTWFEGRECNLRDVKEEEWLRLFGMIAEKCVYEAVILDLGDGIDGLYEILERCSRVYTPYISDPVALAKLKQYEDNLREAGHENILRHTVKKLMRRRTRTLERDGS